ncbi:MAG TPA: hypothetical protein VK878_23230 [Candidatus Deferrimicrobiaceae bacterium]|nr:hypothetical protein [Candidatus Deferrimicrobiaceae bacterium]
MPRDLRFNAKGDVLVGLGDNEMVAVPVGAAGTVLTADPTVTPGASWQTPSGGGVQATASSGPQNGTFTGDTTSSWALAPAAYQVSVPAAVGDVLLFDPSILVTVSADAELDVVSVVGGVPVRYYSTGTTTPGPNGHGGLYIGVLFTRAMRAVRWVVAAEDISGGTVTLSLLRRNGSGVTFGHAIYPSQVDLTNFGGT